MLCTPHQISIISKDRLTGHVAHMGERRDAHRVLVGKPEGRRPLGRPTPRWEDNIKTDLRNVEWGGQSLGRAVANAVISLWVP